MYHVCQKATCLAVHGVVLRASSPALARPIQRPCSVEGGRTDEDVLSVAVFDRLTSGGCPQKQCVCVWDVWATRDGLG